MKRTTVSLAAAARLGVAALAVAGLVAGCNGSASSPSSGSTPTASQSGGFGGPGAGADPALQAKIQECLKAAGIAITVPTGRPSGAPSGMPSGMPSGRPERQAERRPEQRGTRHARQPPDTGGAGGVRHHVAIAHRRWDAVAGQQLRAWGRGAFTARRGARALTPDVRRAAGQPCGRTRSDRVCA